MTQFVTRGTRLIPAAIALALLGGCATAPGQYRLAERDPLEKVNRGIWGFNQAVDKVALKPAASVYRTITPRPARQGISNALANLTEPWSFVNNLAQGKGKRAMRTLARFLLNSTVGLGGLIDQASRIGLRPAREDFGQTLARWGVNGGPYVVLPILGPSTLRDGVGTGVAWVGDPVNAAIRSDEVSNTARLVYRGVQVVSARSDLAESGGDAFLNSSLDPYAAARSAYLQSRRAAIVDQEGAAASPDDAIVPTAADGADDAIVPTAADGAAGADDPIVPTQADGGTGIPPVPAETDGAPAPAGEAVPTPVGDPGRVPPATPDR
ncbi:MAG: VacJ family lipoprotein [Sphingomonas fennica]